jgi:hypothetical protein
MMKKELGWDEKSISIAEFAQIGHRELAVRGDQEMGLLMRI